MLKHCAYQHNLAPHFTNQIQLYALVDNDKVRVLAPRVTQILKINCIAALPCYHLISFSGSFKN